MFNEIIKRFGNDFTLRRCMGLISAGYGDETVVTLLKKFKDIIITNPFSKDKAKLVEDNYIQAFRELENEELLTGYIVYDADGKVINVKLTANKYASEISEFNEVVSLMANPSSPEPDIPKSSPEEDIDLPF